jgi:hypothetical protein
LPAPKADSTRDSAQAANDDLLGREVGCPERNSRHPPASPVVQRD